MYSIYRRPQAHESQHFATAEDVPMPTRSPSADAPPRTPPRTPPSHGRFKSPKSEDEAVAEDEASGPGPRFAVVASPSGASVDSEPDLPVPAWAATKKPPSKRLTDSQEHLRHCREVTQRLSLPKDEVLTRREQLAGSASDDRVEEIPLVFSEAKGKGGGKGKSHPNKKSKKKAKKAAEEGSKKPMYWSTPKKKVLKAGKLQASPKAKGKARAKGKGKAKAKAAPEAAASVRVPAEASGAPDAAQDGAGEGVRSRGTVNMPRPKRSAEDIVHRERLAARRAALPTTISGIMDYLQDDDESMRIVLAQLAAIKPVMPVPMKGEKHLLPEYDHWQLSVYWTRQNVGILRKCADGPPIYCGTMSGCGWPDVRLALQSVGLFAPSLSIRGSCVAFQRNYNKQEYIMYK